MSLWSIPGKSVFIEMWQLSLALAKKHYDTVDLITDSSGYETLKNLSFSNFYVILDDVPQYYSIWSLGKIYAYKHACKISDSFLHMDADVLLWEKLPESLINNRIFVQSEDFMIGTKFYDVDLLERYFKLQCPLDWKNHRNLMTYNMGIFGGTDINLINNYCDFVINMINNQQYQNLWSFDMKEIFYSNIISCLVEQANLGIYCNNNNIVPNYYFKNFHQHKHITYKKYTHLMSSKNKLNIINGIKTRVSSKPYNLIPADVTIDKW